MMKLKSSLQHYSFIIHYFSNFQKNGQQILNDIEVVVISSDGY